MKSEKYHGMSHLLQGIEFILVGSLIKFFKDELESNEKYEIDPDKFPYTSQFGISKDCCQPKGVDYITLCGDYVMAGNYSANEEFDINVLETCALFELYKELDIINKEK